MKKTLENQKINSEGIDRLSEMAGELLEQSNVDRSIATRTRLVLETLLENSLKYLILSGLKKLFSFSSNS